MSKTVTWFPHYIDAMGRDSVSALINKFNGSGYSVWFALLERLCQQIADDRLHLDLNSPAELAKTSGYCMVSEDKLLEILDYCSFMELIDQELWGKRIVWIEQLWENLSSVYPRRAFPYAPGRVAPEKEKSTKKVEDEALNLAKRMLAFIRTKRPDYPDGTSMWAQDIEKIHKRKRKTYQEINEVWSFVEECDKTDYPYTILSGQSLWYKFDKIYERLYRSKMPKKTQNQFSGVMY